MIHAPKIWRHYFYGINVDIYTNHKSLHYDFKEKELNLRQRQWLEILSDYDVDILYHPGKANVVADAFSYSSMDTTISSLVTEVKERQYEDHVLAHYRDIAPQNEKTPFEITEDGVLKYRSRLGAPDVVGLRQ
ncbi:PREDICTED: uncharacterized protein LOC109237138 [Nicotiana attenuata]|uniref:uncharacterized protein LOC109237138 n=1 Tax=Nicotiana attenuata TaxID=49451 RepID=UPI000905596B|nr:PREDICTED: uncharacterized protein LOC109237138 [Nicotiana attenuata]